ncbi:MAG: flagellar hook-associated protein 3 [Chloroflexi bacterium]|nr:flagellar hook-associated protein 3 [Chloroflexota bacterium]
MVRVTDRLLVDKLLSSLQSNTQRFDRFQEQVATGRRILRPSDDPTGAVTSLLIRSNDTDLAQSQLNLDLAEGWLNATDVALQDLSTIIQRVRELAVQGASETLSANETDALANEVDHLLDHAMQMANTRYGDRFIFGGFNTRTTPFEFLDSAKTDWQYNGDNGEIQRAVAPGIKLTINTTGDRVFPQVFDVLIGVRDDLRAHNQEALSLDRLGELETVHDDVLDGLLGQVGSKGTRLDLTRAQLSALRLNNANVLSQVEEVDMSEAIIRLNAQQSALQASLATGARIVQASLIEFLR